jgi:hypothetical protein
MSNFCEDLITQYILWLREQISISVTNDGNICEITTPFLDRHNDSLQIYVVRDGESLIITDDGYILSDLNKAGVDLSTEKRQQVLKTILQGFGVENVNGSLQVRTSIREFSHKKHALIQAMLSVNDLFVLAQSRVESFFVEDVERFLRLNEIRFISRLNFTGKSKYIHYFDFAIPSSDKASERIIKAINSPTRDNISSCIFSWSDTRDERPPNSRLIAFLNDESRPISEDSIQALESYEIIPAPWSKREEVIDFLKE